MKLYAASWPAGAGKKPRLASRAALLLLQVGAVVLLMSSASGRNLDGVDAQQIAITGLVGTESMEMAGKASEDISLPPPKKSRSLILHSQQILHSKGILHSDPAPPRGVMAGAVGINGGNHRLLHASRGLPVSKVARKLMQPPPQVVCDGSKCGCYKGFCWGLTNYDPAGTAYYFSCAADGCWAFYDDGNGAVSCNANNDCDPNATSNLYPHSSNGQGECYYAGTFNRPSGLPTHTPF